MRPRALTAVGRGLTPATIAGSVALACLEACLAAAAPGGMLAFRGILTTCGGALARYSTRRRRTLARGVLLSMLWLRGTSWALRCCAPAAHRSALVNMRMTPIIVSYLVTKRRAAGLRARGASADALWDAQHAWAAERARRLIREFGGFYTKIGQVTAAASHPTASATQARRCREGPVVDFARRGHARQMMPPAWVSALGETMDANAPTRFAVIERRLLREFGVAKLGVVFLSFEEAPAATGSVAQVHRAILKDGRCVAVKVSLGREAVVKADVRTLVHQAKRLKRLGLDGGLDLPSVMSAYEDLVDGEFDFRIEAANIHRLSAAVERCGLLKVVALPTVVDDLTTRNVLVMEWMAGEPFTTALARSGKPFAAGASPMKSWADVFDALHKCWGAFIFDASEFHTDPHPGNLVLRADGRIGILDCGQTKVLDAKWRKITAMVCVAMARGDVPGLVEAIESSGEYVLHDATPEKWSLIAYTYFDTRFTPLAGVNLYDVDRSILSKGRGFSKGSRELFPLMRVAFVVRGLMATAGIRDASMMEAWEPFAAKALGVPQADRVRMSLRRLSRAVARSAYRTVPTKVARRFLADDNEAAQFDRLRSLQRSQHARR